MEQGKMQIKTIILKAIAVFFTFLLVVIISLFGLITVLFKGPSPTIRDLFVTTVMETSAAKFLARMYFSEQEIAEIQARNAVVEINEVTESITTEGFVPPVGDIPKDTIEIVDVSGGLFKGKMMIIHDPSRVKVATAPVFGEELEGTRVEDMVKNEKAVAGVNAGGFADLNGVGKGGMPLGIVIKNGKLLSGSLNAETVVVGFDESDKLIVGKMTGSQALEKKLRDAVSFGPAFIVNGKSVESVGTGGGLNPRTVIGQRADGAVLLLVIDGRQPHSLGASYSDCIDVMLDFEAVNACNLDGGSSSLMVYNDEIINICASLYGSRKIPTSFIVK